ncbi:hypothetical protein MHYP_G00274240 [Metynnis hypsauchen]
MAKKEEVGRANLKTFRSFSVEEEQSQHFLMREREESIDLPCLKFPDHPEELITRPVIKSGWLDKTPPKGGRRFQRRWVQLDSEYLRYFQNNKEVYSKRMVSVWCINTVQSVGDQRFELITQSRTFLFRAETNEQRADWVVCVQKVLDSWQQNGGRSVFSKRSVVSNEGFLDMMSPRTKVYTVIKDRRVYLFKNRQEYMSGVGITDIDLRKASLKESSRSFSIVTPYRTFSFLVECEAERRRWCVCLSQCVSCTVPTVRVCDRVWSVESNRVCADCGGEGTEWASINLCVLLCEQCADAHRCLGASVSKVVSLNGQLWTDELLKVFLLLGNSKVNEFWAANVPDTEGLSVNSCSNKRLKFITSKYLHGTFRKQHHLTGQQEALNNALCAAVQSDDLMESLSLLFSGADVNCSSGIPQFPSPLALAKHSGQTEQVELLQHHLRSDAVGSEVTSAHSQSGYLFKVASSNRPITEHKARADFSQRWCSLSAGVFSYYKTDQMTSRCGSMRTSGIVCLSVNSPGSHGYEHTFELYTDGGRVYLFGSDDISTIKEWTRAITMAVLPATLSSVCGLCDRLGPLHCAEGSSGIGWFCLSGSKLQVLLQDSVQNIDLRKLHTLSVCDGVGGVILGWRGGCVHVCSDHRPHFPGWLNSLRQAAGSGTETLSQQQLTESGTPISIQRCIDHITRHGLMSVAIYRKSGANSRVSVLMDSFLRDARSVCVSEEFEVDDVANTLKRFLRAVRRGVFNGAENTHRWLSVTDLTDRRAKISQYQTLLSSLPDVNRETLKVLLNHLYCVQNLREVNQMTTRNLGIVFGPTLFQTDGSDARTSTVVEEMIQNYCAIFNVSEAELQKQLDATSLILNKLSEQQASVKHPSHTICAVYLEKKDEGAELLVQVGVSVTAAELVLEVLQMRGIEPPAGETWSCCEIQEKEDLERELHYQEKVLPVYFSLSPESHLLVRKSTYSVDFKQYLSDKMEVCKAGILQVCELKGNKNRNFNSRHCELNNATFRLYRDIQGSQVEKEWTVQELKLFHGYRRKLRPSTPWGLTLFSDRQQWYICCENEDELIAWMATFLSLKHGGNLWME